MLASRLPLLLLLPCLVSIGGGQSNRKRRSPNIGLFWHITDLHYDYTYDGAGVSDVPISCRNKTHGRTLGMFGDYRCDAPWTLINSSIHAMRAFKPDPNFIIWTGDNAPHLSQQESSNPQSLVGKMALMRNMSRTLSDVFPDISIYPCIGNYDTVPTSQLNPNDTVFYQTLSEIWGSSINDSGAVKDIRRGGFYTVLVDVGIRLISLNTALYYHKNALTRNMEDPADQFVWLEQMLNTARANYEKVIIIGHVPPGLRSPNGILLFYPRHNVKFNDIIRSNHDVIIALHFGHDHRDNFKIFYNKNDEPLVPMFVAPSITPFATKWPARNPGIRLIKYDRDDRILLDILQYYLPLTDSNKVRRSDWLLEYTLTSGYDVPDGTARSMDLIWQRFHNSDGKLTNAFMSRYFVGAIEDTILVCNTSCKAKFICGTKYLDLNSYEKCLSHDAISFANLLTSSSSFIVGMALYNLCIVCML